MPRAVVLPVSIAVVASLVAFGTTAALTAPGAGANPAHAAPATHRAAHQTVHRLPDRTARLRTEARRVVRAHARTVRPGTVTVAVDGARSTVAAQARRLGGRVLASAHGVTSVELAQTRVAALAGAPGVAGVRRSIRARELDVTSEGVAASGADVWQNASQDGTGVTIGVVDAGFAGLAGEITAGRLPDDTTVVNEGCTTSGSDVGSDQHGTAVAEIVHQMAPGATLVLYCIVDNVGFAAAEQAILAHSPQIRVVTSSLGFPGDSRGDGTGDPTSAAATVKDARQHGVLWIQSAGNSAEDHWGGTLADRDRDGLADLDGVYDPSANHFEADEVYIAPGSAAIELQWDQWPSSSADVSLELYGYQCTRATTDDPCVADAPLNGGNPYTVAHTAGDPPYVEFPVTNTSSLDQVWDVFVVGSAFPAVRYDLTYEGDVDGPSLLACNPDANGTCRYAPQGYGNTVSAPANSPYALAVGAANAGDGTTPRGTLEVYSSRGPTIDGRVKPDILGWDGVSSNLSEFDTGFYGTSAAAPHVAGAAADVLSANPALDAAGVQNFLEQRANGGNPFNPADFAHGHGLLTLGSPSGVTTPTGASFQSLAPVRLLDTRTTTGGHRGRLGAGQTVTLAIPSLPADATAVAVNLTGVGATASTYLSAYPGGTAYPGTSNLNLQPGSDPTAAAFAVVTVHNKSITIRNAGGTVDVLVDELGWFGTGAETGRYTALGAPTRVVGNQPLPARASAVVDPGLPDGASAAIVNVTTSATTATGYLGAAPTCSLAASTLNFTRYARANLAIVQLDGSGRFCVTNGPSAAHLYVDVLGYMSGTGAQYVALPAAQRIVDTRTGNGGSAGQRSSLPLGPRSTTVFYGGNVGDVPQDATALVTGVVEAANTTGGFLSLAPGSTPTSTSTLNFTPGRVVANVTVIGLHDQRFGVYNGAGNTQAAVDLFGYFRAATPG